MITKHQQQILDFIIDYQKKKGYAPSLDEIRKEFKLASVSTVHFHISKLHNAGFLDKEKNKSRAIDAIKSDELVKIPIVGTITAGQPIKAMGIPNLTIAISKKEISTNQEYYALQVKGDSMINNGIFDGDIVVIRKQETADNGQTAVVIINNNKATIRRICREKSCIELQPTNQEMLPFYQKKMEIRGIVVKIIRNLEGGINDNTLAHKKKIFLNRIKSKNPNSQNKYKRVALSPIRYAGGKL